MSVSQGLPSMAILAGGLATRLGALTKTTPKSMIDVAGQPFIAHQLRLLRKQGVQTVVICVGHQADQIREFVGNGDSFGLAVHYSFDGDVLQGTGGALRRAVPLLGSEFMVIYGDSYLTAPIAPIMDAFWQSRNQALMTVYQNDNAWDASNVVFKTGKISVYDKKLCTAEMRHIDYGLGVFRSSVFENYPPNQAFDLACVYSDLLAAGQLAGYEVRDRFYEIGSVAGISATSAFLNGEDL